MAPARIGVPFAALALAACTVWTTVPLQTGASPTTRDTVVFGQSGISDDGHGVRVRLTSGAVFGFRAAALHDDTVYGFVREDSIAFASDSVRQIEVRTLSRKRTAAIGSVGLAIYLLAAWSFSDQAVP